MSEMGGSGENGERGRVIPFEKLEDLQKKRAIKLTLEAAIQATRVAYEGRGKIGKPDETQRRALENALGLLQMIRDDLLERPLTADVPGYVAETISRVKIALTQYLSEEQFVALFGTDNLA